jgi:hypothetical protein
MLARLSAIDTRFWRYGIGSESKNDKSGQGNSSLTTGAFGLTALRSALLEWSVNLGESCRQILDGNFSGNESNARGAGEVLMLCDHSLFLIKVNM